MGAGTYYVRGYFVPVAEQTLILDQYGIDPSYKVGLKVEERIITADEDATLMIMPLVAQISLHQVLID
ncbi:MAG: hypothetical protein CM15mV22_2070 [Eurybiavirus sp.]|nr:MAG: hypothetical protein CM15mV22_2070 [Eurybiavirus sp.]